VLIAAIIDHRQELARVDALADGMRAATRLASFATHKVRAQEPLYTIHRAIIIIIAIVGGMLLDEG